MDGKPVIFVAFGITGDLMRHKILPALFALHEKKGIPEIVRIVGVSRQAWNTAKLQEYVAGVIKAANPFLSEVPPSFLDLFYFQHGDVESPGALETVAQALQLDTPSNILFYLSLAPALFEATLKLLFHIRVCTKKKGDSWVRIIVEKPFGHDLESARALNAKLQQIVPEEHIYRADHYLQKALPRAIPAFRSMHKDIAALWNKAHVASIHIRLWETIGVGKRSTFYDQTGALRDVGQNHILQLLGLITMEQSQVHSATSIQKDRAHILEQLRAPEHIGKGTYRAQCKAYTQEIAIPTSQTETYFALQAGIASDTWADVPISLDAGKYLPRTEKYMEVRFAHPEPVVVNGSTVQIQAIQFQLVTQEILLRLEAGSLIRIWSAASSHTEYEQVVHDAIQGKRDFFVSMEEVAASWHFIDPILNSWKKQVPPLETYEKGEVPSLPW